MIWYVHGVEYEESAMEAADVVLDLSRPATMPTPGYAPSVVMVTHGAWSRFLRKFNVTRIVGPSYSRMFVTGEWPFHFTAPTWIRCVDTEEWSSAMLLKWEAHYAASYR